MLPNKAKESLLTAEAARELLAYDPATGVLTWKKRVSQRMHAGAAAGTTTVWGYISVIIKGRSYRAHRLIWLIVHGVWPENEIDHRDLVRSHNWLDNLREATHAQNMNNKCKYANNTSGHAGVHARGDRFRAYFNRAGKMIHIGSFSTAEAMAAARAAAIAYRGEFLPSP